MRENDHPTQHASERSHDDRQQASERPKDDRRTAVNPAENPMPQSPAPDPESVRRGEENWHSVTSK